MLEVESNPSVSVAMWPPAEVAKTSWRPKNLRRQYPKYRKKLQALIVYQQQEMQRATVH